MITPENPSYLVENFRTYLTYLSTHQIKLTKAKGYFAKKDLIAIYSKMKGEKIYIYGYINLPIIYSF
jgi:hypothetical protein